MCEHKRKRVSYRQKGGRNWLSELLKVKREREREMYLPSTKQRKGVRAKSEKECLTMGEASNGVRNRRVEECVPMYRAQFG